MAWSLITIRQLRDAHPHLFYQDQHWFDDEPFIDAPLESRLERVPDELLCRGIVPVNSLLCPNAVQLAECYVRWPLAPIWESYLWCADMDRQQQRIYVGGVKLGHGFEIHRHLHITKQWGIPSWRPLH